jgi:hypothetical protein
MDTADIEAEWLAGGGEVSDLLQFLQLERCPGGTAPARTASWGRASHA